MATVDHRGFDPADVDAAEGLLAGFTVAFGPRRLAELAQQVVDRIDPDGTLPKAEVDAERRHLTMRTARDGMYVGEFRLTPAAGVKLRTVLSPLAAPRNTVVGEHDGRPVSEVDPRHHGQRMHDALEDACDRLLRSGTLPDSGGTPTTVIITVPASDPSTAAGPHHHPTTRGVDLERYDERRHPPVARDGRRSRRLRRGPPDRGRRQRRRAVDGPHQPPRHARADDGARCPRRGLLIPGV